MSHLILFLNLLMGHAVADFALQSDWMAQHKNRNHSPSFEPGRTTWPLVLAAHSLIHGFLVTIITGNIWFGIAESCAHFVIDAGKCESWYGIYPDQLLHVLCKVLWAAL